MSIFVAVEFFVGGKSQTIGVFLVAACHQFWWQLVFTAATKIGEKQKMETLPGKSTITHQKDKFTTPGIRTLGLRIPQKERGDDCAGHENAYGRMKSPAAQPTHSVQHRENYKF